MDQLKKEYKNIYEMHLSRLNDIKNEYDKYENEKMYSNDFIISKKAEKQVKIDNLNEVYIQKVNDVTKKCLSSFEPNTEVTNSLEYQTKLSNLLKLLDISKGNIEANMLDFIVEAKDMNTLNIIKNSYLNYENENARELAEYFAANNFEEDKAIIEQNRLGLIDVLKYGEEHSYNSRVVVYNLNH